MPSRSAAGCSSRSRVVLTNAHVVEDSTRLFVYIRNQAIDPGATVLALDADLDLAALRVQTDQPVPFLPLAAEVRRKARRRSRSAIRGSRMSYTWD